MPSGTIASGGAAQLLVGPNSARNGVWLQNNSDADLRMVEGGAAASATSGMKVPAGGYYETPPNRRAVGSWSVFGATTGQTFEYGEW